MAYILPDTPPTSLPTAVLRVFRALKALPDTFYIWHHLAPWQINAPDFLVINQAGCVLIIKVCMAAASQTTNAAQFSLLESERPPLGFEEARILSDFEKLLNLPARKMIENLVIFPNIPDVQVQASRLERAEDDPAWAGKDFLSQTDPDWISQWLPTQPLDMYLIEKIRQQFTPEIVVSKDMTVREPLERRTKDGLTNYLLDINQEWAVKADLDLSDEGKTLSDDFRMNIINGVAGSGKTLILLYRLRLLYHLYPKKSYLVLTHNRPLSKDLEGRFFRLEGKLPANIEFRTFNAWCYQHWPKNPAWIEPLKMGTRQRLVEEVWKKHFQDTSISTRMFISEIDWLKDQPLVDLETYISIDRRGRGFRLNAEQREHFYNAFLAYQKILADRHSLDWSDVPQLYWQSIETGQIEPTKYDVILVDEAQFFAPLWIRIIQKIINPHNGHLFIVADPTQGFLGRGASWKSLGLDARGKTHLLRRSYRTTREIMQFSTLLYRLRVTQEKDDDILAPDLMNMPSGAFPEIIPLSSPQDEITRIANEVEEFVKKGFSKKHLLILHSDANGVTSLIKAIDERLGRSAAIDPKDSHPGDYVRVTTINAGAGLESQIVFLVGLRDMFEEEQSLRLSDEERENLIRDNTRKLYMATTRAGQRLVISYVGDLPEVLKVAFKK